MTTVEKAAPAAKPAAAPKAPVSAAPAAKALSAAPAKTKAAAKATATPKPAVKTMVKTAAKPAMKAAAKAVATAKPAKIKKPKMVRDSFTFPKTEYAVLDELKLRAAKLGHPVKKTELLRAGLKAIAAMQDAALIAALKAVPSLKTGRPAKAA